MILEAALNGGTSKATNPNVPRSTDELVRDALDVLEAGAAIVHTHTDEPPRPPSERPSSTPRTSSRCWRRGPTPCSIRRSATRRRPEASFAHFEILTERCGLRIGIVDPGCVNLAGFAYVNTPDAIRHMVALCTRLELGPSIAIFEPGFLRHALGYWRRGALPRGALLKFYMGGTHADLGFGLPPTPRMLDVYLDMLGDCPLPWSVGVLGGDVFEHGSRATRSSAAATCTSASRTSAARASRPTSSCYTKACRCVATVGRPIASCAEAARILDDPCARSRTEDTGALRGRPRRRPQARSARAARRSRAKSISSPAVAALPVPLAEQVLLQLAGGRARQRGDEVDRGRALEVGEALAAEREELGLVRRCARPQHDERRGVSPHFSWGTPITAHSSTAGCW